jgi:hypothetical protein
VIIFRLEEPVLEAVRIIARKIEALIELGITYFETVPGFSYLNSAARVNLEDKPRRASDLGMKKTRLRPPSLNSAASRPWKCPVAFRVRVASAPASNTLPKTPRCLRPFRAEYTLARIISATIAASASESFSNVCFASGAHPPWTIVQKVAGRSIQ